MSRTSELNNSRMDALREHTNWKAKQSELVSSLSSMEGSGECPRVDKTSTPYRTVPYRRYIFLIFKCDSFFRQRYPCSYLSLANPTTPNMKKWRTQKQRGFRGFVEGPSVHRCDSTYHTNIIYVSGENDWTTGSMEGDQMRER